MFLLFPLLWGVFTAVVFGGTPYAVATAVKAKNDLDAAAAASEARKNFGLQVLGTYKSLLKNPNDAVAAASLAIKAVALTGDGRTSIKEVWPLVGQKLQITEAEEMLLRRATETKDTERLAALLVVLSAKAPQA